MTISRSSLPASVVLFALVLCVGCKKDEQAAPAAAAAAAVASVPPNAPPPRVRGTIDSVTNDAVVITTSTGPVRVAITPPLLVFKRVPSNLSKVSEHSFVGVTSVPQPDGSQKATEIHIFAEALRGTGEGSNLMQGTGGGGQPPSTMTNGTVTPAPAADNPSRMTNGTVAAKANPSTLTVQYAGGSQTITIPPDVTVTELAQTDEKLTAGETVNVLTKQGADGTLTTSQVIISTPPKKP